MQCFAQEEAEIFLEVLENPLVYQYKPRQRVDRKGKILYTAMRSKNWIKQHRKNWEICSWKVEVEKVRSTIGRQNRKKWGFWAVRKLKRIWKKPVNTGFSFKLPAGFEPATYALRMRCSTSWATEAYEVSKNAAAKYATAMTSPGIEPGFTPWEGVVLTAWPRGQNPSRGDKIRTCDLCVPNAALYQTEPRLVSTTLNSIV